MDGSATDPLGLDPFERARRAAADLLSRTAFDALDTVVVLGTGLGSVAGLLGAEGPPIDLSTVAHFPPYRATGHRPDAWALRLGDRRVLVMAGRHHLYEGLSPAAVVHGVRAALAAGCRTVVLTCSAGGVDATLAPGELVAVRDHVNMTGTSPLFGLPATPHQTSPFVDLTHAWSPALRQAARSVRPDLREAVYAQMPGPHLETPAEIRMLAALGVDVVGMSMVPELIAARHLGAQVLGLAVVANAAAGNGPGALDVAAIGAQTAAAAPEVAHVIAGVLGAPA